MGWQLDADCQDGQNQVHQEPVILLAHPDSLEYRDSPTKGLDFYLLGMAVRICYFVYRVFDFGISSFVLQEEVSKEMKKYQIIYADPPWQYKDKSKSHGGGAESHYPCMTVEKLCALPIYEIAETDSVLLIWVTMPMLEVAFPVIKSWGFTYKTCAFTWIKENKDGTIFMGMGRHTRQNPELLLLATKGKGLQRISMSIKNPQFSPRLRHSEKPEKFKRLIEELYGDKAKIELFARTKRLDSGWDCWGNEVESDMEL